MDDDKDGGIEVDESDEVGGKLSLVFSSIFPSFLSSIFNVFSFSLCILIYMVFLIFFSPRIYKSSWFNKNLHVLAFLKHKSCFDFTNHHKT